MFKKLKIDPKFRYPSGYALCGSRAENLGYYLAEAGFAAKTIHIGHAPTLIAMDRQLDGSYNGNYDDYKGNHLLIQIDVEVNGKLEPYLLDPQYMESPMPREEYFLRTMGQNCQKQKDYQTLQKDLTNCYFSEHDQNIPSGGFGLLSYMENVNSEENGPYLACGWLNGKRSAVYRLNDNSNESLKKDKIITCSNCTEKFVGKNVSSTTYKELIIDAYDSYDNKLKELLEIYDFQIQSFSPKSETNPFGSPEKDLEVLKFYKEALVYSLKEIESKKAQVRKNLSELK
jgi:hypothetical protein